jgi:hypothetical protein
MRTPAFAAALAAAALAIPATAAAKEIEQATVCGASACTTVKDRTLLESLVNGGRVSHAPAAAAFYRVTIAIATGDGHSDSFTTVMVPGRDAIRGEDGRWMALPAATKSALLTAAGDLAPFPASKLTGAASPPAPRPAAPPAAAPDDGGLSWFQRLMLATPILIAAGLLVSRRRPLVLRRRARPAAPPPAS